MTKKLEMSSEEALMEYPKASKGLKTILERTFGKNFFLPKKIKDKIKGIDDILKLSGYTLADLPYKNAKIVEQKSINSQWLGFRIAEVLNEGTILNWKDSNQSKYFIYSFLNSVSRGLDVSNWGYCVSCPAGLAFKSRELAEFALKLFKNIYEDFLMVK